MPKSVTSTPVWTPHVASAWAGRTPLGVTVGAEEATFAVVAEADAVRVRLTHTGTREMHTASLTPVAGEDLVWSVTVPGEWSGWSYVYEIDRDGTTLSGIIDPRATLIRNDVGVVWADTTPVAPRPELDPRDAVIYELHVRDFTRDLEAGIRPSWSGRYLGLSQPDTRFEGTDCPTGLDHITSLGVNVVQIMPVHSFDMPYDPAYEWGYMPNEYFAPFEGYASGVEVDAPVREFKLAVSGLHEAGLRVTLDVVYNHTSERWPTRFRGLMALAPQTYFRFQEDGEPWDGSACGNEFRSDSDHGRRLVVEACLHWVREFGVDGFRFDLMGLIDIETMEMVTRELHAIDPTIMVYGEPWAAGPTPIEVNDQGKQRGKGWAVFNDILRDGVRGSVFLEDDPGFLVCGEKIPRIKDGYVGAIDAFTDHPLETINYIECHDNHTLADRIDLTLRGREISPEIKSRMSRLGVLILMTCPGIPFIHSGQEFLRSKHGHANTYNLGDVINNIRWREVVAHRELVEFHEHCIRMRLAHPTFRKRTAEDVREGVAFLDEQGCDLPTGTMGIRITDPHDEDAWSDVVILLNGGTEDATLQLPEGQWVAAITDCEFVQRLTVVRETCTVAAHSGTLLYRERGDAASG